MEPAELDWNLDSGLMDHGLMDQSFWLRLSEHPSGTLSPTGSISSVSRGNQLPLQSPGTDIMMQQELMQPFGGHFSPNSHRERDHSQDLLTQWNLLNNEDSNFGLMDLEMAHRHSISESSDHIPKDTMMDTSSAFIHNQASTLGSISPPISPGSLTGRDFSYRSLLSTVKNYVKLLQNDEYRSPFIHPELFHGGHQHLSSMQKSSMATCSAAALENKRSRQFARKAIAAERERLVHDFVRYQHNT